LYSFLFQTLPILLLLNVVIVPARSNQLAAVGQPAVVAVDWLQVLHSQQLVMAAAVSSKQIFKKASVAAAYKPRPNNWVAAAAVPDWIVVAIIFQCFFYFFLFFIFSRNPQYAAD